jgi:ferritin
MLTILYTGCLTLFCIIILHHIYNYIQSNLTIPKVYDVVKPTEKKYQEIQNILQPTKQPEDEITAYLKQFKPK